MKVTLMWNCPHDCQMWPKPYPCDGDWDCCLIKKRNIPKFVVVTVGYPSYLVTEDTGDLEMVATGEDAKGDWKKYLKTSYVANRLEKLPTSNVKDST